MKFKIFVCIALTLIVLLQAAIVTMFAYGAVKVKDASSSVQSSVNQKTDALTGSTSDINSNLNAIKGQLQNLNSSLGGQQ